MEHSPLTQPSAHMGLVDLSSGSSSSIDKSRNIKLTGKWLANGCCCPDLSRRAVALVNRSALGVGSTMARLRSTMTCRNFLEAVVYYFSLSWLLNFFFHWFFPGVVTGVNGDDLFTMASRSEPTAAEPPLSTGKEKRSSVSCFGSVWRSYCLVCWFSRSLSFDLEYLGWWPRSCSPFSISCRQQKECRRTCLYGQTDRLLASERGKRARWPTCRRTLLVNKQAKSCLSLFTWY